MRQKLKSTILIGVCVYVFFVWLNCRMKERMRVCNYDKYNLCCLFGINQKKGLPFIDPHTIIYSNISEINISLYNVTKFISKHYSINYEPARNLRVCTFFFWSNPFWSVLTSNSTDWQLIMINLFSRFILRSQLWLTFKFDLHYTIRKGATLRLRLNA